jgi:hypothetical protein
MPCDICGLSIRGTWPLTLGLTWMPCGTSDLNIGATWPKWFRPMCHLAALSLTYV